MFRTVVSLVLLFYVSNVNCQCTSTLALTSQLSYSQRIESPNYPLIYPAFSRCSWLLDSGGTDRNVYVWVAEYNTEPIYDSLKIYDGTSDSDTKIADIHSTGTNEFHYSSGQYLYLHFSSDYSVQKTGFWLQFFSVYVSGTAQLDSLNCGPVFNAVRYAVTKPGVNQQILNSFPGKYAGSDYCYWRLDAGSGETLNITVVFADFFMQGSSCVADGINVYYGTASAAVGLARGICNATEMNDGSISILTNSQYAYITFKRGSVGLYRGFVLSYDAAYTATTPATTTTPTTTVATTTTTATTTAAPTTVATTTAATTTAATTTESTTASITSDSTIVSSTSETTATDSTTDVTTATTGTPSTDSTTLSMTSVSGTSITDSSTSSLTTTSGTFTTDSSTTGATVTIPVGTITTTASGSPVTPITSVCNGGSLHVDEGGLGYVTSPNYPYDYTGSLSCQWLILTDNSLVVQIEIILVYTEVSKDILKIYDGPTSSFSQMTSLSGTVIGGNFTTSGSSAMVQFTTDPYVHYTGFKIAYTAINQTLPDCYNVTSNTTIIDATQTAQVVFSHDDFDNSTYESFKDIFWLIKKPNDTDNLIIYIEAFLLEYSQNCVYDYLKVYDGPCTTNKLLYTLCGEIPNGTKYQAFNSRYTLLHFHSDNSVNLAGFKLRLYTGDVFSEVQADAEDDGDVSYWWIGLLIILLLVVAIFIIFCFIRIGCVTLIFQRRKYPTVKERKRNFIMPPRTFIKPQIEIPKKERIKKKKDKDKWPIYKPENKVEPARQKERIDTANLLRNVLPIPDPFARGTKPEFLASKPGTSHVITPKKPEVVIEMEKPKEKKKKGKKKLKKSKVKSVGEEMDLPGASIAPAVVGMMDGKCESGDPMKKSTNTDNANVQGNESQLSSSVLDTKTESDTLDDSLRLISNIDEEPKTIDEHCVKEDYIDENNEVSKHSDKMEENKEIDDPSRTASNVEQNKVKEDLISSPDIEDDVIPPPFPYVPLWQLLEAPDDINCSL